MPLLIIQNGKLLMRDGKLALSTNCCCDCLAAPCTVVLKVGFSFNVADHVITNEDGTSDPSQIPTVAADWSISFRANAAGSTEETLRRGEGTSLVLSGDDCGFDVVPHLAVGSDEEHSATAPFEAHAVLVRHGTISFSYKPNTALYEYPQGSGTYRGVVFTRSVSLTVQKCGGTETQVISGFDPEFDASGLDYTKSLSFTVGV